MQIVLPEELNPYDVLVNDWLVFSKATLEATIAQYGGARSAGEAAANVVPPSGASGRGGGIRRRSERRRRGGGA